MCYRKRRQPGDEPIARSIKMTSPTKDQSSPSTTNCQYRSAAFHDAGVTGAITSNVASGFHTYTPDRGPANSARIRSARTSRNANEKSRQLRKERAHRE